MGIVLTKSFEFKATQEKQKLVSLIRQLKMKIMSKTTANAEIYKLCSKICRSLKLLMEVLIEEKLIEAVTETMEKSLDELLVRYCFDIIKLVALREKLSFELHKQGFDELLIDIEKRFSNDMFIPKDITLVKERLENAYLKLLKTKFCLKSIESGNLEQIEAFLQMLTREMESFLHFRSIQLFFGNKVLEIFYLNTKILNINGSLLNILAKKMDVTVSFLKVISVYSDDFEVCLLFLKVLDRLSDELNCARFLQKNNLVGIILNLVEKNIDNTKQTITKDRQIFVQICFWLLKSCCKVSEEAAKDLANKQEDFFKVLLKFEESIDTGELVIPFNLRKIVL
eukprot:snap_masked-scaffold_6-processed-gene-3.41-mRNA-1 protein AED:1.00 eAED:1.00 QI:0/0/0/0/1/1/2/0/339